MASDKLYLETVLEKLDAQTTLNTSAKKKVKNEAENALSYLVERREFWAQQNPDYPGIGDDFYLPERRPSWRSSMKRCIRRRHHEAKPILEKNVKNFGSKNPYG